ncbi:MAG: alpha/beta fold hydrolase [Acidimicrobiales bacterium]
MADRLVLAHGFTQTASSWGRFGELLARSHALDPIDLPGHGDAEAVRATLPEAGALVADRCDGADLLGYSLGARVSLHAVLARPDAVRRLVLIGATPGIEDDEARAARRRRDDALADTAERDVEGFLRRWVAAPMFAGVDDPGLSARRRNTGTGLASSLRLAGTGTQAPLWGRLGEIDRPTLLVAGANDVRFAYLATRMAHHMSHASVSLVPGAGHAAHLEQPEICAAIVSHFLR